MSRMSQIHNEYYDYDRYLGENSMSDDYELPPRQVIQIATGVGINIEGHASHWLYALCNDGTIWRRSVTEKDDWTKVETPPMAEPEG